MDCKHFVEVPELIEPISGMRWRTAEPYFNWLKENKISRFRGGHLSDGLKSTIIFRFEKLEDATAFKLRWYE